jgi:hypothetical protein
MVDDEQRSSDVSTQFNICFAELSQMAIVGK